MKIYFLKNMLIIINKNLAQKYVMPGLFSYLGKDKIKMKI